MVLNGAVGARVRGKDDMTTQGGNGGGSSTSGWVAAAAGAVILGAGVLYFTRDTAPVPHTAPDPAPASAAAPSPTVAVAPSDASLPEAGASDPQVASAPATPAPGGGDTVAAPAEVAPEPASEPAPEPASEPVAAAAADGAQSSAETGQAGARSLSADPAPQPSDQLAPQAAGLDLPRLDLVRVEPDGSAVVAGTGPANGQVTFLLDGAPIDSLPIGADGKFAGFLTLPLGDSPSVLTLLAERAGEKIASADQIILAPRPVVSDQAQGAVQTAQAALAQTGTEGGTEAAIATPPSPVAATSSSDGVAGSQPEAATAQSTTAQPTTTQATTVPGADSASAVASASVATPAQTGPQVPVQVLEQTPVQAPVQSAAGTGATPVPAQQQAASSGTATGETPSAQTEETVQAEQDGVQVLPTQGVAVLRADADGVELLQPASPVPELFAQIALDTISYDQTGQVILRAGPRAARCASMSTTVRCAT